MPSQSQDVFVFDRITPADVSRVLRDERFKPVDGVDVELWRTAIELGLSSLEGLHFEYALKTNFPNIHRDACKPFDREFGASMPWLKEAVVIQIRRQLMDWLNLCFKPALHARFGELVALARRKNGAPIDRRDIESGIGSSISSWLRYIVQRFGRSAEEQQLAWALIGEHIARVAEVEKVQLNMPIIRTQPSVRNSRVPEESRTTDPASLPAPDQPIEPSPEQGRRIRRTAGHRSIDPDINPRLGPKISTLHDLEAAAGKVVVVRVTNVNRRLMGDCAFVRSQRLSSLHYFELLEARIERRGTQICLISQENQRATPVCPENDFQVRQWQIFIDKKPNEEDDQEASQ